MTDAGIKMLRPVAHRKRRVNGDTVFYAVVVIGMIFVLIVLAWRVEALQTELRQARQPAAGGRAQEGQR